MRTFNERAELAKRFAFDVARMRRCLLSAGRNVGEDDIVFAWSAYSEGVCAGWLMLPEDDDTLVGILLKHLPPSGARWRATLQDAGDGSGDCIIDLPAELFAQLGWKEGDTLTIGIDKEEPDTLILRRAE